jgi:hypothetical protein
MVKNAARALPGAAAVKALLRRRFAAPADAARSDDDSFDLAGPEHARVEDFVQRFYARDIAALAALPGQGGTGATQGAA